MNLVFTSKLFVHLQKFTKVIRNSTKYMDNNTEQDPFHPLQFISASYGHTNERVQNILVLFLALQVDCERMVRTVIRRECLEKG